MLTLNQGVLPSQSETAIVILIYKKGAHYLSNSYCPISQSIQSIASIIRLSQHRHLFVNQISAIWNRLLVNMVSTPSLFIFKKRSSPFGSAYNYCLVMLILLLLYLFSALSLCDLFVFKATLFSESVYFPHLLVCTGVDLTPLCCSV